MIVQCGKLPLPASACYQPYRLSVVNVSSLQACICEEGKHYKVLKPVSNESGSTRLLCKVQKYSLSNNEV